MTDAKIKKELVLRGVPASPGIAMGQAYLFLKEIPRIEERPIAEKDVAEEIARVEAAIEKSSKELTKILSFARQKVGDAKAKIFEAQVMVLEDPVLIGSLKDRIRSERKNGEYIVSNEIGKYARLMLAAHDESCTNGRMTSMISERT
jgi:phosphotransferase system enzyme I (PtsI)